jgi:hypothetical protein
MADELPKAELERLRNENAALRKSASAPRKVPVVPRMSVKKGVGDAGAFQRWNC